jgi:NADH-quinone oxidoreductase subunit L
MSDEQDMRKMGGIAGKIKFTYMVMLIGTLALTGFPYLSGYFSKDMILEAAYAAHSGVGGYAFWMGIAAAALTSFYSWRLMLMTFHGKPRADEYVMSHIHESPAVMLVPLLVLAIGAVGAGYLSYDLFVGEGREAFWGGSILVLEANDSIHEAHHVPGWVKLLPMIMMIGGFVTAVLFYKLVPSLPGRLASTFRPVYLFLLNKWYVDELYDRVFVRPAFALGRGLWQGGDGALIDGVGPDGVAAATRDIARRVVRLQSGLLYHYAFAMIVGVAVFVTWYMVGNAG